MNELLKIFEFAADRTLCLSKEQSVAGEGIVIGDVTVIPISKISCGFAGGGADLNASKKPDALAAGVGAKVTKTPLSFLAVQGSHLQMLRVSAETVEKVGLMDALAPLVSLFKERFPSKKGDPSKKETDAAV